MRKILLYFLVLPFIIGCGTDGYRIRGEYPGVEDGTMVYLANMNAAFSYIDSAVVKNGCFEFTGRRDTPVVCMLLSSVILDGGPVVIENGDINVLLKNGCRRSGTPLNNDLQKYLNAHNKMSQNVAQVVDFIEANNNLSDNQRDSLQIVVDGFRASFVSVLQQVMGGNMNNDLGVFLLTQSENFFTSEEFYSIMSTVPAHLRNERFNTMYNRVAEAEGRKVKAMATGVGGKYVNFELADINGNQVLFSDIVSKSKYTLLDFWASWCAPCRQEMPVVKDIYKEYKGRGLSVVSISLDDNTDEWKEAVSSLGMSWIQLCNPAGGSAEVADAYGVETIPTLLLIDSKGKIVLRGEPAYRVAEKMNELLK